MAKKTPKTRKELLKEPDEFMTITGKLIGYAVDHKNQFAYALGILAAAALIVYGYRFLSIRSENKAAALLDQNIAKYEKVANDTQPLGAYEQVSADFQLLLDKYGSKKSGKIARLTYANICYRAGKYEQAIGLYKSALMDYEKHPTIYNEIMASLGYAYEQQEDFASAVQYFEELSSASDAVFRGEALYHLGWLYDRLGQTDKSKAAFNKIISDHEDFIYIDLVKEKLAG